MASWPCRALLAGSVCTLRAAGLAAWAKLVSQPLHSSAAAAATGRLDVEGPVNGSWHLCTAPVVATRSSPPSPIPRILHQTYREKQLPEVFSRCRESWVNYTPSWKHRLWLDHENRALIKVHYPWFLETYDAYEQPNQRVDAARILILHRFGGVFADMDIEAVQDPSPLFDAGHDLVFFYQLPPRTAQIVVDIVDLQRRPKLGTITNTFMASKPGHPFWIFLAEMMLKGREPAKIVANQSDVPITDVQLSTGSSMLSRALAEYQSLHPEAHVGVFSRKYWSPFQWSAKGDSCEIHWECRALYPQAFVVSHWTRSSDRCKPGIRSSVCLSLLQEDTGHETSSWCP